MKSNRNFVWIDLEMTGLNPDTDTILEIATVITDDQLNVIAQGPDIVIHQPDTVLHSMSPWCTEQHALSGLTKASRASTIDIKQAEHQTFEFIQTYCIEQTALLAGSSIWQDRAFLRKYMPPIVDFMHYKMIDVSSLKELVERWYPDDPKAIIEKKEVHRALEDIYESIEALRYVRTNFFRE